MSNKLRRRLLIGRSGSAPVDPLAAAATTDGATTMKDAALGGPAPGNGSDAEAEQRSRRMGAGRPAGRRLSEATLNAVRRSILEGDSLYQTVTKTGVGMGTVTRLRKELRGQLAGRS